MAHEEAEGRNEGDDEDEEGIEGGPVVNGGWLAQLPMGFRGQPAGRAVRQQ